MAQVDIDGGALGVHRPIDLGVVGDSAATAADLVALLGDARPGYRGAEVADSIARRGRWNDEPTEDLSTADRIDPRTLSRVLDTLLPADRIVAIDSGNFMGYPSAYLGVPDEFGFCFTQAFQSIGLGLATAIGAALARPDRLPVLAAGDGGFLMSIAELETAVRLGIPLLCVVYNDAAYGAEVHHFGPEADLDTVTFPDTDIAALASGFGAQGLTVRRADDLRGVTDWLSAPTRSTGGRRQNRLGRRLVVARGGLQGPLTRRHRRPVVGPDADTGQVRPFGRDGGPGTPRRGRASGSCGGRPGSRAGSSPSTRRRRTARASSERSTCSSSHGRRNWIGTVIRLAASTSAGCGKNPPPKMAAVILGSIAVSGIPIAVPSVMPPPYPIGASVPTSGSFWSASKVACHSGTARSASEMA